MPFAHVDAIPDDVLRNFLGQFRPGHGWLICDLLQLPWQLFVLAALYGLVSP